MLAATSRAVARCVARHPDIQAAYIFGSVAQGRPRPDNAERYLQLAIQAVLDISHHIVADRDLPLPADSRSLFELLARQKVTGSTGP